MTGIAGAFMGGTSPLLVGCTPNNITTSGSTSPLTSVSCAASTVGGTVPYSYAWVKTTGSSTTCTSPGAQSTTFGSGAIGSGASKFDTWKVTVTDALLNTATSTVDIEFDRV